MMDELPRMKTSEDPTGCARHGCENDRHEDEPPTRVVEFPDGREGVVCNDCWTDLVNNTKET